MTKKDYTLRVRMDIELGNSLKKYVEKSEDYDNVSVLIRDLVRDFLSGKLVYNSSRYPKDEKINKSEIVGAMKEIFETGVDEILKSTEEMNKRTNLFIQLVENGFQTIPSELPNKEFKWNIEKEIIKVISEKSMTSEQLARIFEMTEPRILRFLNPMLKRKVIGLNNQMEYVLVESKEQINELNFGDD